jgi:hypothetical protein
MAGRPKRKAAETASEAITSQAKTENPVSFCDRRQLHPHESPSELSVPVLLSPEYVVARPSHLEYAAALLLH